MHFGQDFGCYYQFVKDCRIKERLEAIQINRADKDESLADQAVDLAAEILKDASSVRTRSERYKSRKMARMMQDLRGKSLTLALADQVFRPPTCSRSASQFRFLLKEYGIPRYLPFHERVLMRLGAAFSSIAPGLIMPAVTAKMRAESSEVILPSEEARLEPHLHRRRKERTRMNINQLGEAILGEEEAERRIQQVIQRLESPDCEYISVKISSVFSQIHLVAYEDTLEAIKIRLRRLYRTAIRNSYIKSDGTKAPKFVNLDMEEYRDLHLTCDAFKEVLMEPEFRGVRAGIVLQAYLPDAYEVQKELTDWASKRVMEGGSPIKIRIVKGANLAMEQVEASLHGWPLAPYANKADVDANFKRMLHFGSDPEHAKVVHLGVASHNIFEVAYAMLLRIFNGVEAFVEFEMLEGMANHQARAVCDAADGILLYAPVVRKEDFHSAIAYLVRRLDENTAEENFLHDLFGMEPGDLNWEKQKQMFLAACRRRDEIRSGASRCQNRSSDKEVLDLRRAFSNSPDTDWSLAANVDWIRAQMDAARDRPWDHVPLQIGGEYIAGTEVGEGNDPSRPGVVRYTYALANAVQVDRALRVATEARVEWESQGISGRRALLKEVAVEIANARGWCITTMMLDGGKSAVEADSELSEAIDFANYYADSLSDRGFFDGTDCEPLGTIVVTPPWNFPFAIPCGGVLAALMAGNTVILKPPPETVLTAWILVEILWAAGIPKRVLQFLPCPDDEIGRQLVTDERSSGVILTGAYETARMFQSWKPEIRLFAETSGKNSLIITSASDPDQAIKDLVRSAFGHSGQKCSAASIAIVEAELYDSEIFQRQLRDAAASLPVGSVWNRSSVVTPLIRPPDANLKRALTECDPGERWLLEPKMIDENPCLWSPGIKIGVRPDSWYRRTECFGPVLGLIRADDLQHAIRIQNDSDFGLTGGIHSLDSREAENWREQVEVGNAYINRGITGAIVRRQPFGGWKNSSFGPGAKAGGPNYVSLFCQWSTVSLPTMVASPTGPVADQIRLLESLLPDKQRGLRAAAGSYVYWWKEHFSREMDFSRLHGETNHFRYRPYPKMLLRTDGMGAYEIALVVLAASVCSVELELSSNETSSFLENLNCKLVIEEESTFIKRIRHKSNGFRNLRTSCHVSTALRSAANEAGLPVISRTPLANGRLELMDFLREQSISETTHRYGNIIPKASMIPG